VDLLARKDVAVPTDIEHGDGIGMLADEVGQQGRDDALAQRLVRQGGLQMQESQRYTEKEEVHESGKLPEGECQDTGAAPAAECEPLPVCENLDPQCSAEFQSNRGNTLI